MSPLTKGRATVVDKLLFVVGVFYVLLEAVLVAVRYWLLSSRTQPTLRREVTRVLLRALHDLDRFSIPQLQWAFTAAAYRTWISVAAAAEGDRVQVFTEAIAEGAKLHWVVGSKGAKKVILYYHGGGYVLPLSLFHLNFNNYIRKQVKKQCGVEVKLAFLEYGLLPEHTYPTQYRQAAIALQHVLDSGVSPADLIIGGDSVGGQLALQVLSHILHPHPNFPPVQLSGVPLAGVFTISPWVVYDSQAPSYTHKPNDIISVSTISTLSRMIRRRGAPLETEPSWSEEETSWSEPLSAPSDWWRPTSQAVRHMMIIYGSEELFTEDNAAFAEKIRQATRGTNLELLEVKEPNGFHIGPVVDATLGRKPGDTCMIITRWASECLA